MSDDKRYIREKCGCVEVVELDARATTMVPCAAHFDADDFGHQTATSCPACDDDGGPCALCNRAFSQPVDNAAQPDEKRTDARLVDDLLLRHAEKFDAEDDRDEDGGEERFGEAVDAFFTARRAVLARLAGGKQVSLEQAERAMRDALRRSDGSPRLPSSVGYEITEYIEAVRSRLSDRRLP